MPPRRRALDDDDTIPISVTRSGVSARLVVICLLLLAIGIAAFALLDYMPMRQELTALRADVATLSGAAERAESAEAELDDLVIAHDELQARFNALSSEHSALTGQAEALRAERAQAEAALADLRDRMQSEIAAGDVSVRSENGRLGVGLSSRVLFRSGSADLSPRGQRVLRRVAESLRSLESRAIQVGGHTDANPISEALQERFATNWELSTARATNVVRFLEDECEVPGGRLIASGLAHHRPAATNRTARGRLLNRRIELTLIPLPQDAPTG